MTLVILLLALLALCVRSGSEPRAPAVSNETPDAPARPTPEERHETDDGLSSQLLLSRPGEVPGKARPQMTSHAQTRRSPWQGDAAALNLPNLKGLMAIDARTPSGACIARASIRAT